MAKKRVTKLLTPKNLMIGGQLLGLGLALASKRFRGRKGEIMKAAGSTLAAAGATDGAKAAQAVDALVAVTPEPGTAKRRSAKTPAKRATAARKAQAVKGPAPTKAAAAKKAAKPAAKRKPASKAS